jgi:hypothetical protein
VEIKNTCSRLPKAREGFRIGAFKKLNLRAFNGIGKKSSAKTFNVMQSSQKGVWE